MSIGLIRVLHGDLFSSGAHVLVNPVNCVGVSGKGLAKEFKARFPLNEMYYRGKCLGGAMDVGKVLPYGVVGCSGDVDSFVVNFPTKRHWRERSDLEFIERGMVSLVDWINSLMEKNGSLSIGVPALGCGEGGLFCGDVFLCMVRQIILYSRGIEKNWWLWMDKDNRWDEDVRQSIMGEFGEGVVFGLPDVSVKICYSLYLPM